MKLKRKAAYAVLVISGTTLLLGLAVCDFWILQKKLDIVSSIIQSILS